PPRPPPSPPPPPRPPPPAPPGPPSTALPPPPRGLGSGTGTSRIPPCGFALGALIATAPRPPPPPRPTSVPGLSDGKMITSYFCARLPPLSSGSNSDVYGRFHCSKTRRVQPS